MKPIFIKALKEVVNYKGKDIYNHPFNISLCNHFEKSKINWYPDNEGIPSIIFYLNGNKVEWVFINEKERQDCIDYILCAFSNTNAL